MQNPAKNEVLGRRYTGKEHGFETWEDGSVAPAIGKTGYVQERAYFPYAGLERGKNVSIANPIRCRWQSTDSLPPLSDPLVRQAIQHCQRHYFRPPDSTRVFLATGEYALYALTGEVGITDWRGWALPYTPPPRPGSYGETWLHHVWTPRSDEQVVLATYHLAFLFRSPWETTAAKADWAKLGKVIAGKWPEPLPPIQRRPPAVWPMCSAFDTEYDPLGRLIRYSMATRQGGEVRLWVVEAEDRRAVLPQVPVVGGIPQRPRIIFHNMPADIGYLEQDILPGVGFDYEDSMSAHAVLWSDLAHDLGYVGSLYARINRWKHLAHTNPVEYSAGDAIATLGAWEALSSELSRDPSSESIYRTLSLPALPVLTKAMRAGIRVDQERVKAVIRELGGEKAKATRRAQAWAGYPINLGSPAQVSNWLYGVEGIKEARKRWHTS